MNIKKAATSTIAAGFVGAAMLGLGVTAGTASAAPAASTTHSQQQVQPQRQQPQQRVVTVTRPNYRPFVYQGQRVTPRYNAARGQWGFTANRTFVHVVLARR